MLGFLGVSASEIEMLFVRDEARDGAWAVSCWSMRPGYWA